MKLCKLFRYMECKRNKWDCKREEVVDVFREGKRVACLNGDEIESGVIGTIVCVQEMERAKQCVAQCSGRLWVC